MKDRDGVEGSREWYYERGKSLGGDGKGVYMEVGCWEKGGEMVYWMMGGKKVVEKGGWELGESMVSVGLR